jgi:UDP-hydrolysing UDP-N-acetyl-D-glucosamine 2-epimerase
MGKITKRRICFVTGTRAEFGLMRSTLCAIEDTPSLQLEIVATGMHLDPLHGDGLAAIADAGFDLRGIVTWPGGSGDDPTIHAMNTGQAIAGLAETFKKRKSDIVLVVGDRVEAFAAAAAGHLSQRAVAHVHGGDRALGQIDDSLRHAITKLAHVHFPATAQSARRIARLGEEQWRIHQVGSPGNDDIVELAERFEVIQRRFAGLTPRRYALIVLHPASADEHLEKKCAEIVLRAAQQVGFDRIMILYPNNDPGGKGIMGCWQEARRNANLTVVRDLPRRIFLGLLRDAAVLVGNSSAGIIEAAAFGTPVVDIGPRQAGRERSRNVAHCEYDGEAISRALSRIWDHGKARRIRCRNVYGGGGAGRRIAEVLADLNLGDRLLRKLIRY